MTGSPADCGPGYIVRMRCGGGGLSYSSTRMTKGLAEEAADGYEILIDALAESQFIHFESEYGLVRIRSERVTAIELVRVLPLPQRQVTGAGMEHAVPGNVLASAKERR